MRLRHALSHTGDKRQNDQSGNSMTNESSDDENQRGKDDEDAIYGQMGDIVCDMLGDGVEETRR